MTVLKTFFAALVLAALLTSPSLAQYGTAPSGYFPVGYSGDTLTGILAGVDGDQITLTHPKGDKVETFVGHLDATCQVPRGKQQFVAMRAGQMPMGSRLIAFFKGAGKNSKDNVVIAVTFQTWNGQTVATENQRIYFCTTAAVVQFRAH